MFVTYLVECEKEFGRGETEICPLSLVVASLEPNKIQILLVDDECTPFARFGLSRSFRSILFWYLSFF